MNHFVAMAPAAAARLFGALALVTVAGCGMPPLSAPDAAQSTPDSTPGTDAPRPDAPPPPPPDAPALDVPAPPPDMGTPPMDATVPDVVRPDATAPIDARRDATPPPTDAPSPVDARDGAAPLALRPYTGPTARLRYIDLQLLTASASSKICVYGADGDPRPYAVLADRSHSVSEGSYNVAATYVTVPAGVALRASDHLTLGAPDASTAGCDAARAAPFNHAGMALRAGDSYTTALTQIDSFFTDCDTRAEPECRYFPRSITSRPRATCATERLYVFSDGQRVGSSYAGGVRVINLTTNASRISYATGPGSYTIQSNSDLSPPSGAESYSVGPLASATVRFCPHYISPCTTGMLTAIQQIDALGACARGEARWLLASVSAPRVTMPRTGTTLYVVGDARRVASDGSGLVGASPLVVVASDVSDGALP